MRKNYYYFFPVGFSIKCKHLRSILLTVVGFKRLKFVVCVAGASQQVTASLTMSREKWKQNKLHCKIVEKDLTQPCFYHHAASWHRQKRHSHHYSVHERSRAAFRSLFVPMDDGHWRNFRLFFSFFHSKLIKSND